MPKAKPASPEQTKAQMMQHLYAEYPQLKPHQIAAIVATAKHESDFRPNQNTGDSGTAFGLFQHRGARQEALRKFAKAHGKDASDPLLQVDFAMHEMGIAKKGQALAAGAGSEKRAGQKFLRAGTLDEAVVGMAHFERYRGYKDLGGETGRRLTTAQQYMPAIVATRRPHHPSPTIRS